ncbi:hypothetical protein EDD15DRAFT_959211 [Pisolithus albus]|nr:hypothetical protein EDD15DRAFT_959211 [Pisolithus albus]
MQKLVERPAGYFVSKVGARFEVCDNVLQESLGSTRLRFNEIMPECRDRAPRHKPCGAYKTRQKIRREWVWFKNAFGVGFPSNSAHPSGSDGGPDTQTNTSFDTHSVSLLILWVFSQRSPFVESEVTINFFLRSSVWDPSLVEDLRNGHHIFRPQTSHTWPHRRPKKLIVLATLLIHLRTPSHLTAKSCSSQNVPLRAVNTRTSWLDETLFARPTGGLLYSHLECGLFDRIRKRLQRFETSGE